MDALAILKLVNTGVLVYEQVAPLVMRNLETGQTATLEELKEASGQLGTDLAALVEAIKRAEAEGR